jgi:hypothetical protein
MADQTISTQRGSKLRNQRVIPFWREYGTNTQLFAIDVDGTISGSFQVLGVPIANVQVALYYRATFALVGVTYTDSSGNWSISGLDRSGALYFAVTKLETSVNALIFDKLTPV